MKILALNAYYEPEIAASLYLSSNLYEDLAKEGNSIKVLVPNPSRGISRNTYLKYKKIKIEKRNNDNLIIKRFSLFREKKGVLSRTLRYLLMNLIMFWKAMFSKFDIIYTQSTPPTQGLTAALVKIIRRKRFIYNLQDIFPNSLINTGLTKKGSLVWRIGRLIEGITYKYADTIIVISNDFKNHLIKRGVPKTKINVIYNWVDQNKVFYIKRKNNLLFEKYNLDKSKFYITYCGNLGHSQNLDLIIKVAKDLEDFPNIKPTAPAELN